MKKRKKILFISSTGGHLSELLQLEPLINEYESYLVTEWTKSNETIKDRYRNVFYVIYGTKSNLLTYVFKFAINSIICLILQIKIRPDIIITTGSHTCVPMCYIGKLFGSKIIYIETFANFNTRTLTGRLVYPIADSFFVQWESMLKLYPKSKFGGRLY